MWATGLQPHALRGLRGKRRTRGRRAEEHEFPVPREPPAVILAGRSSQNSSMPRGQWNAPRNAPLAVELTDVAQVDQRHLARAVKPIASATGSVSISRLGAATMSAHAG